MNSCKKATATKVPPPEKKPEQKLPTPPYSGFPHPPPGSCL